jgi:hypothetical protein
MVDVLWHMQLFLSLQVTDGGAFRSHKLGDKIRNISIAWKRVRMLDRVKRRLSWYGVAGIHDEFRQRAITCHDATRFLGGVALRSEH